MAAVISASYIDGPCYCVKRANDEKSELACKPARCFDLFRNGITRKKQEKVASKYIVTKTTDIDGPDRKIWNVSNCLCQSNIVVYYNCKKRL